ncbi:MAG TPA: ABC transporter substrate-binding protein [Dehalococcoidia bacterium]|nr:ABC transporter substrate-binding protein [Dehalococcoidia bacterium]
MFFVTKRIRKGAVAALAGGAIAFALAGCAGGAGSAAGGDCEPEKDVTIAYQPGLGYAALLMAKQEGSLEKELPGTKVKWLELNSGSAIRDGILAKEIHVGSGGTGPFLVGYDSGVDWKVLTGLNNMNLYLMVEDPKIQSLEDLKGAGSIAMPAPDSIQSVVLRKGADEELGDAKALDSQIVSMGHPDGVQALIAGQLAGHLTSPPFQGQEADAGARAILKSYDLFGEHTFNSVYTTTEFAQCNEEFTDALVKVVVDANQRLTEQPEEAAQVLAKEMGEPVETVVAQVTAEDVAFTTKPIGFEKYAEFMQEIGLIKEVPDTEDLFFENETTSGAN